MLVTRDNFEILLPQIENELKQCVFIAIDCEFSGLIGKDTNKNSLFDTNDERYVKLKESMQSFMPLQFGMSIFNFVSAHNRYESKTYTFYLLPRKLGFGGNITPGTCTQAVNAKDIYYLFQSTAIQFLCKYQFDFNKLFYKGINYMSMKQENEYLKQLNNSKHNIDSINAPPFIQNILESVNMDDEALISHELNDIQLWFDAHKQNTSPIDDKYMIKNKYLISNPLVTYLFKKELQRRYKSKLTLVRDVGDYENAYINITDVSTKLDDSTNIEFELELLNEYTAFTRLYRLIKQYNKLNKPIVGHNIYLDILLIYQHFDNDLPNTYAEFKSRIHAALPNIYDTKYLSYQALSLKFIPKNLEWPSNALDALYSYFKHDKGRHIVFNSPVIELKNNKELYSDEFHNAGFDSYCTGYCFIRLAHIFVGMHYETLALERNVTSREHMSIVSKYKNCINVIRANTAYIKLDGPDPISGRPAWLYVKCKSGKNNFTSVFKPTFNGTDLANLFGKYGSIDVQMLNKSEALVAVASHRSANDILKHFRKHQEYIITKYNPIRHSPLMRAYLWGSGCILTSGLFMWTLYKLVK